MDSFDKFFDSNNPVMRFLSRLVDLAIVNVMTLVCAIPLVTIGGSMAAMNHVLLHLVRGDETYVTKMFIKSFRDNFRQGIPEGLLVLGVAAAAAGDMWLVHGSSSKLTTAFMITITVVTMFLLATSVYMFALQSRYVNTVGETITNAFRLAVANLPRTLGIIICWLVWVLALIFAGNAAPLIFMFFGLSLPGYISAMIYNKVLEKLEAESGSGSEQE